MRVSSVFSLTVLLLSALSIDASPAHAQGAPAPTNKAPAPAPKPAATPAPKAAAPAPTPKPAAPAPKAPTAPSAGATAPKAPTTAPSAGATAPKGATQPPKADATAPKGATQPPKADATAPATPEAQAPKEKAAALLVAGRNLLDAREPDKAVGLLEEAHGILQDPESGFELMRAYTDLNKLVEALNLGEKLVAMPVVPKEPASSTEARKKSKEAVDALTTRVSTLQLRLHIPTKDLVRVKVDDKTLLPEQLGKPIRVNPGKREILVTAPGFHPLTIEQVVEQGVAKQYPVMISMKPLPKAQDVIPPAPPEEPPAPPMSPLVKIGIGVSSGLGVVAIATGIAAGVSYVGFVDAYNRRGCGADCDTQVADRGPTLQGLMFTWPIAGIAAIGAGTATFLYARKEQKTPERTGVVVVPTAGGILVHGRF